MPRGRVLFAAAVLHPRSMGTWERDPLRRACAGCSRRWAARADECRTPKDHSSGRVDSRGATVPEQATCPDTIWRCSHGPCAPRSSMRPSTGCAFSGRERAASGHRTGVRVARKGRASLASLSCTPRRPSPSGGRRALGGRSDKEHAARVVRTRTRHHRGRSAFVRTAGRALPMRRPGDLGDAGERDPSLSARALAPPLPRRGARLTGPPWRSRA